jgi:hypothetical protein
MTLLLLRTAFLLLLCAATVRARVGTVETSDGRFYEGHIRFESNSVIVVNPAEGLWVQVPLVRLAGLTMQREIGGTESSPPGAGAAKPGELPAPWREEDVGSAPLPGNANWAWGKVQVRSAGTNIAANSDAFHFVFKPVRGNSEIVARVLDVRPMDPWAKAGLMMRASLAADAPNLFVGMGARAGFLQWRSEKGDRTERGRDPGLRPPYWLKLKRDGENFAAFMSRDGRQWMATQELRVRMDEEMLVGIAVSGGQSGLLNRALFDRIEEAPALRNRWFVPRVTLKSGSVAAGHIVEMDDSTIRFQDDLGTRSVATAAAANLCFQFVPERFSALVVSGRPGILLSTGQFIDGECRGIRNGKATISSVPLGLREYGISYEVIAISLRRASAAAGREYVARTADGSTWVASAVEMDGQELVLHEPALGFRRVSLHELVELRRRS